MIYPPHFEQKIGFDQVRKLIGEYCISPMGTQFVEKIRFSSNAAVVNKLLNQVTEFRSILSGDKTFPARDYLNLREDLSRLKTPGSYIDQEALFDLKTTLKVVLEILSFFNKTESDAYPELKMLLQEIFFPEEILTFAEKIIDDKGDIKNSASTRLSEIRKQLASKNRQALRETKKAFESAKKAGWVPDNSELTIRDGRTVIPLNASNKRALGGIIHDESATGQTVFVEPAISFELGNQIRELENEERREIIKILTHFTDSLRPYLIEILGLIRFLGLIDFIRAKAVFSDKIQAEHPKLSEAGVLVLEGAKHPLLFLAHLADNKEVVPLDLELNSGNRILVISGPNAGGKSVCLKTIGLLQYMFQCGLPIPCSPDSKIPLFERLFIDIGDEQSLENDLSTYSSHLLNMKYFLNKANANTLFLIDEFGTGTEPQLGGAIAEATLEHLNRKKAFGVVTTHYSNLKLAAEREEGIINGAMLFDSNELRPLYKLRIGNPGSSFAFEIAKNIGFPGNVLTKAKKKSGGKHVTFDQQLHQMEIDKLTIEKKQEEVKATDEQLSEMVEKYTTLLSEIKKTKKQLIGEAKEQALKIISDSNKAVEKTIKEIKEAKADKTKTKEIRKKLVEKKVEFKVKVGVEEVLNADTGTIKIGDFVRVIDTDIVGQLLSVDGDNAVLDINDVRLKTSFSKLELTIKRPPRQIRSGKQGHRNIMHDINEKAAHFELSLDLRGNRGEEAISELQRYIDNAILLNISEVNILHGKGDGILRSLVRDYLTTTEGIENFSDAPVEFGGAGITKVYFR